MGISLVATLLFFLVAASCTGAFYVEMTTRLGRVKGNRLELLGRTVEEYRGIPYAQPPVGRLRFLPPQPARPRDDMLDATSRRTACPQVVSSDVIFGDIEYTEDCLQLNIWSPVPSGKDSAPVIMWIHGGGFALGCASCDNNTGAVMAAKTGLVVVSINYRLGILGFLDAESPEAPGNMGLMDQNMALRWIQENIRQFGGDPSRVTILGVSAGSLSTHAHVISPMSRGLFRRAYLMSGNLLALDFVEATHKSISKGDVVATVVGCAGGNRSLASDPDKVIQCLRTKSADELVVATSEALAPKVFPFLPTFHNEFLPKMPASAVRKGLFNAADLIMGVTEDEGVLALIYPFRKELLLGDLEEVEEDKFRDSLHEGIFSWLQMDFLEMLEKYTAEAKDKASLRRSYVDYLSDSVFVCPMHLAAEGHSNRGQSVYAYVFGHVSTKSPLPSWMGAAHALDISYVFGAPIIDQKSFNTEDAAVSEGMLTALWTFATIGVPQLPGSKPWPKYTSENPVSVYIDYENFTDIAGFRKQQCDAWRPYL